MILISPESSKAIIILSSKKDRFSLVIVCFLISCGIIFRVIHFKSRVFLDVCVVLSSIISLCLLCVDTIFLQLISLRLLAFISFSILKNSILVDIIALSGFSVGGLISFRLFSLDTIFLQLISLGLFAVISFSILKNSILVDIIALSGFSVGGLISFRLFSLDTIFLQLISLGLFAVISFSILKNSILVNIIALNGLSIGGLISLSLLAILFFIRDIDINIKLDRIFKNFYDCVCFIVLVFFQSKSNLSGKNLIARISNVLRLGLGAILTRFLLVLLLKTLEVDS